jgi:D-sedoheptulose 7-phosphate isomerase
MLEQRIQQQFFELADLQYQAAEVLCRPIEQAAGALVAGLTAGGKVLVAGLGASASLAQMVTTALTGCFERDRPGLAAIALGVDGSALSALAALPGGGPEAVLARQVDTLGQPGDLLLLIASQGNHPALLAAVAAAQGKDMTVIALTGRTGGAVQQALGETDVLVAVPHDRRARVLETHLLVLHCLCDAIDLQLLGEQDPA